MPVGSHCCFFVLFPVYIEGEFKGMVLQARTLVDSRQEMVVGTWISYPNGMEVINCTEHVDDTVAYGDSEFRTVANNVFFEWLAPENLKSPIQFV